MASPGQGATVLRLINSPSKKRFMPRQITRAARKALIKLSPNEVLDVVVSLAHLLPQSVKDIAVDMGVKVDPLPKSTKRFEFSDITTSKKHRYKEDLLKLMSDYNDITKAHAFVTLVLTTTELSESLLVNFLRNGIDVTPAKIPSKMRMTQGINQVAKTLCSPETMEFRSDSGKMELILNTVKQGKMSVNNRGDASALADTFSITNKFAKRILQRVHNGMEDELFGKRRKRGSLDDSQWPELIKVFCLSKPICREAPGETVSVKYGSFQSRKFSSFSVRNIRISLVS